MTTLSSTPVTIAGFTTDLKTSPEDLDDVEFFFGHHGAAGRTALGSVEISSGFFRSLLAKDGRDKRVVIRPADGSSPQERCFSDWSGAPSFIPSFWAAPFRDSLVTFRGTVLQKDCETVLLVGENYVGKSSVGLYLAEMGWRLITDHLVLMDRETGVVHRYLAPVGVRGKTADLVETRSTDMSASRTTISDVTGRVILVRPETIYTSGFGRPQELTAVVRLVRRNKIDTRETAVTIPPTFPAETRPIAEVHLPSSEMIFGFPEDADRQKISQSINIWLDERRDRNG